MGCYRSRDERFHWNRFTNPQKRRVVNLCRGRKLRVIREHLASIRVAEADLDNLPHSGNALQSELF